MRFDRMSRGAQFLICANLVFFAVSASAQSPTPRAELLKIADRYAAEARIPASLVRGVILVESDWNEHLTGAIGEIGLMQLRYGTARELGYEGTEKALYDPETNIRWGVKYLAGAYKLAAGDLCQTSLKYLAGHEISKMIPAALAYCSQLRGFMAAN